MYSQPLYARPSTPVNPAGQTALPWYEYLGNPVTWLTENGAPCGVWAGWTMQQKGAFLQQKTPALSGLGQTLNIGGPWNLSDAITFFDSRCALALGQQAIQQRPLMFVPRYVQRPFAIVGPDYSGKSSHFETLTMPSGQVAPERFPWVPPAGRPTPLPWNPNYRRPEVGGFPSAVNPNDHRSQVGGFPGAVNPSGEILPGVRMTSAPLALRLGASLNPAGLTVIHPAGQISVTTDALLTIGVLGGLFFFAWAQNEEIKDNQKKRAKAAASSGVRMNPSRRRRIYR